MERLPVAGGHLVITDESIHIDKSFRKAVKRCYQQSKIITGAWIVAVVIGGLGVILNDPIIRPGIVLGAVGLALWFGIGFVINNVFRPHITTEKTIPRESVEMVVYQKSGRIRRPTLAIAYEKGGERKARNVSLSAPWLADEEPLKRILPVFRDAGIEINSATEMDGS
ncbi:hypothetical protein [Halococcus sp. PRR34]|uniref:hypothetical protein n=1 Tax=Halococcus sp. PRR34 TaxID=3020830 RepID=UPI00236175BC|nr:hypothetical protein [Halococcus sp. PRR34]